MDIKQGDTIKIRDWSYTTLIKPDGSLDAYSRDGLFTVVATNLGNLPVTNYAGGVSAYHNDTIIQHNDTKEVVFCHAGLLNKMDVCPKCGHCKQR